ncbi:hypothetical protein E4U42_005879 [Claviceps africana]|uniref:Casein kinase II beta 2 subunit n=1 Tax=Claviceps africana TaxID=83212 RepID=A0A8K0NG28_9HYPO|nr:hypothetical protein E4U42_005879 [Claviceps africana]
MPSRGATWVPAALRKRRAAATKTSHALRTQLADVGRPFQQDLQAIPVRIVHNGRRPIHPAALLKRQKRGSRWFASTATDGLNRALRRFITTERVSSSPRFDRTKLPSSNTSRRIARFSGRAPFCNTLRPNLTGGAMPRTAGGYSLGGGGARYFSHTPAMPAQVVQDVSQAMRAFFLSGHKIRYDGRGPRGGHQYRTVSRVEDDAMNRLSAIPRWSPGSFIDFQISPTVTAMSPLAAAISRTAETSGFGAGAATRGTCLDTEGFLDVLSTDFDRALQDLAVVYSDLRRLSALGSLPTFLHKSDTIRVRFPGVDALTVERLCDDLGVQRGLIGEDAGFNDAVGVSVALKFPFAPQSERALSSPGGSARSLEGSFVQDTASSLDDDSFVRDAFTYEMTVDNPDASDPEGYGTMSPPNEYEGFEGIHRFLAECDRAEGRLG